MQRVSNLQIYRPLQNIPFDPVKSCIAIFISEILYKTLREEEANAGLFDFLLNTIYTLDLNDCGTANFHLLFLVHYSRYLGFYPNTEHASEKTWFDLQKGSFEFTPIASLPSLKYNQLLSQLFGLSFEHLNNFQINHHHRNYLTEYLLRYYSIHVDNFGKIKSFSVLQNVFQD